ncbi:amidohydrolase [Mycoplasma phocimorsus]|uniref:amidohydrolase n=1 Tax=Mycoplasma phocimorsus TaxID=3045839 RepID=UPI0024BF2A94|nr:amidohydrolase [Mycoplasma phocimorsus]MDJ1648192.1 amidohydrolase [Mycoplasma phocimorsus]
MKIWIKNATIITVNENFDVLKNSHVYIEKNKIVHVGKKIPFVPDKIINAKNKVVMPGLINSHTHIAMTLLRNFSDDISLEEWLFKNVFPVEDKLSKEDIYYGAKIGIIEMIQNGTTAFNDMYFFTESIVKATDELKIRAMIGRGMANADQNVVEEIYNLVRNNKTELISFNIAPHATYTNNKNGLKLALNLSKELKLPIHIHLNETKNDSKKCIKDFKKTQLQLLNDLGYLERHLILAHSIWISNADLHLIENKNVSLVHCPISNAKLASGIMGVNEYLKRGINVSIGNDGPSSNNTLDMFQEMKFASLVSKLKENNPKGLDARKIIEMATVNGAKALGYNNLGRIKKDYLADLIIIDISNISHTPNNNIVNSIIFSTTGYDVDTTIVNGKILYENKKFKIINQNEINKTIKIVNSITKKFK